MISALLKKRLKYTVLNEIRGTSDARKILYGLKIRMIKLFWKYIVLR